MKQTRPTRLLPKCRFQYYTFTCSKCSEFKNCKAKIEQAQKEKQQQLEQKRLQQQKLQKKQKLKRILLCLLVVSLVLTDIIFIFLYKDAKKEIQVLKGNISELEALASTQTIENSTTPSEEETSLAETSNLEDTFVENEEIPEETIEIAELSADAPSDTYYYDISDEEKLEIAKVVYAEAGAECFEGKVAVAAVILNRYYYGNDRLFSTDSIYSVIHKPYQFASISHVTTEKLEEIPDCMKAVEAACKGWDPTRKFFSEGALYFYNPKNVKGKAAKDREGIKVLAIGNHNFHYDFEKM